MRKAFFGVLVAVLGAVAFCGGGVLAAGGTWGVSESSSASGGTYYLNAIRCTSVGRLYFEYYSKPYYDEAYNHRNDHRLSVFYIMGNGETCAGFGLAEASGAQELNIGDLRGATRTEVLGLLRSGGRAPSGSVIPEERGSDGPDGGGAGLVGGGKGTWSSGRFSDDGRTSYLDSIKCVENTPSGDSFIHFSYVKDRTYHYDVGFSMSYKMAEGEDCAYFGLYDATGGDGQIIEDISEDTVMALVGMMEGVPDDAVVEYGNISAGEGSSVDGHYTQCRDEMGGHRYYGMVREGVIDDYFSVGRVLPGTCAENGSIPDRLTLMPWISSKEELRAFIEGEVASEAASEVEGSENENSDCATILTGIDCDGEEGAGIFQLLRLILTILTAGVGILATIGLVVSGIQYAAARDDTGMVTKVKSRIFNIVIGLLAYGLMWIVLNWLIPGGIVPGA